MSIDTYPPSAKSTPDAVLGWAVMPAAQGSISGSEVVLPGLSVSVFVQAGRTIRITASAQVRSTQDGDVMQVLIKEGTTTHQVLQGIMKGTTYNSHLERSVVLRPSAGPHTYSLNGVRAVGTGTMTVDTGSNNPTFILVEDITGGSGGPGPITLDSKQVVVDQAGKPSAGSTIAGLTATVNVPAGRRLKLTAHGLIRNDTAGAQCILRFLEGSTYFGYASRPAHTANNSEVIHLEQSITPTPGVHTYDVWLGGSAGTMLVRADPSFPFFFLIEDATGTEAPTGAYYEALWTPMTPLLNGWVNYGNVYPPAAYRKFNEMLFLRGLIRSGTVTNVTSVFQLPVGYRPAWTHHVATVSNDVATLLRVQQDGNLTIGPNVNAAWFSMDGIAVGLGS